MSTALFEKLRQQAHDREHTIIAHCQEMWGQREPDGNMTFARDLPRLGRLARQLEEYHTEWQRDLLEIAHRNKMRINHDWPVFCSICGRSTCPGAEPHPPHALLGAALLKGLLKGLGG